MKPQKTILQRRGLFFALAFLLAGCADPESGTLTEIYKYPKDLWGEWIRIDTGKVWYITSNYMEGDTSSNTSIELKRQSENVIKVTEEKREYYLYASRIPNGSFSGSIVGDGSDRAGLNRSMTGMGGIGVTIANLNDAANEASTKTDDSGNFTATGTIPGDSYEVTAGGQTTVVTPNTDGENIGTVTVTDGVNFKIGISPDDDSVDMMQLYVDPAFTRDDYIFMIEVQNTGTENCQGAMYRITRPDGLTVIPPPEYGYEGNLGTIKPGEKTYIPVGVFCGNISEESVYKTIGITITDVNGKVWNDSVALKFNREKITFHIRSAGVLMSPSHVVSGVVIVPSAKAYHFRTSYESGSYAASVTVPKYSTGDYLIVFSGATADTEAKYSLGVGTAAADPSGFVPSNVYEDDNTEEAATRLQPGETIKSYLLENDIDYYRVNLGSAP
jgi:hypothetical protein